MDGIVNVIKPPGMSSHQVVGFMRRTLGLKRIGHTGTLDPGAGGLLTLCLGKATRLVPFMVDYDKAYVAELTLGISTATQDAIGETLEIKTDFHIRPQQFADVLASFRGGIEQIPPMASAIRVGGQRLYELDRKGITVPRAARQVKIKTIHINKVWTEHDDLLSFGTRVLLYIECSKGTYIRTLCHDIGEKLGVGGHMSFLSRVQNGPFTLADGYTLDDITAAVEKKDFEFVQPLPRALPSWTRVKVNPLAERRIHHGNFVTPDDLIDIPSQLTVGDKLFLLNVEGEVLALAEVKLLDDTQADQVICQPFRVFMEG